MVDPGYRVAAACLLSFASAWLLIRASLGYAVRRGLLDQPGRRRSHRVPTPRGGGLGLVLGVMPGIAWALARDRAAPFDAATWAALAAATATVLLVGWRDDHASLPILPRVLSHLLAALLASWAVFHAGPWSPTTLALAAALTVVTVWSINLHNFMDGIDALLGTQMLFYFVALGCLAHWLGYFALATSAWCIAAGSVAFLLFNRPPARIFMGDVGSGALGLLTAAAAALLWRLEPQTLWALLILCSAFVADASLTLVSRMLRGRRWYTAHREHLYQWLARSGFSHARTGTLYMLWNLLLAAPCAWAAMAWPASGWPLCLAVYVLAALLWWFGKRACMVHLAGARRHAA